MKDTLEWEPKVPGKGSFCGKTDRKFAVGFAAGVVVCFVVLGPMFFIGKSAADKLLAAATGNRAALESCTAKMADLNSSWTLIMESGSRKAVPTTQVLDGLVAVSPGQLFIDPNGTPYPRWEVPIKITPYVDGPLDGAVYYYWDPATHALDGPHVPLRTEKP